MKRHKLRLIFFGCLVVTIVFASCQKREGSQMPEPTSDGILTNPEATPSESSEEEDKDQDDIVTEKFLTLINRMGSRDEIVVGKLGEGTIHRDVTSGEIVAREYKIPFLEDEDAIITIGYNEKKRVDEIQIILSYDDIEFYKDVLNDMLGGSVKDVSKEEGAKAPVYQWERNNTLITLGEEEGSLQVKVTQDE